MKPEIHPRYRDVVFHDTSVDEYFTVDTSSASHPFYTGAQQVAKAEGRVAKFNQRFNTLAKGKE